MLRHYPDGQCQSKVPVLVLASCTIRGFGDALHGAWRADSHTIQQRGIQERLELCRPVYHTVRARPLKLWRATPMCRPFRLTSILSVVSSFIQLCLLSVIDVA
jgi:hypothetical protein